MIGIDTNVLVRYLTGDSPAQAKAARTLVEENEIFIGTTVLLEADWVLRSVYGFSAVAVAQALRAFAGLPQVNVEDADLASLALSWVGKGLDFADALHLARTDGCVAFATFDRAFAKRARAVTAIDVRQL